MSEIRISAVTSNSEEMGLTGDANELRFYALAKDIAGATVNKLLSR